MNANYRHDIDGLRAVAVTGVILFHLNPVFLPGGFLGVDVFFVISGFLITGILLREHGAGRARLADFWKRRVRRLLPAFACMALVSGVLAATLMPWSQAYAVAKQTLAVLVGVGNWYQYRITSNYWGADAEWSPLLHTWSLSAEEQFYLVYPLVVGGLFFFRSRALALGLLVICIVASAWMSVWYSRVDEAFGFYMTHARAWELLIGASGALYAASRESWRLPACAPDLGVVLIFASFALVAGEGFSPFPHALPATVGALLICLGSASSPSARVLAAPFASWVGKASYSLYLWHWPALVMGATLALAWPGLCLRELTLAGGLVLAAFSYGFVEPIGRRASFTRIGAPLLVALLAGAALWVSRFPDPRPPTHADRQDVAAASPPGAVLLMGDSHASALANPLRAAVTASGASFLQHSRGGTGLVFGSPAPDRPALPSWRKSDSERAEILEKARLSAVVISCRWENYHSPEDMAQIQDALVRVRRLQPQARLVVVGQPPVLDCAGFAPAEWRAWCVRWGAEGGYRVLPRPNRDLANARLARIAEATGADFVSSEEALLSGIPAASANERLYSSYSDDDHLSEAGASAVASAVVAKLGLSAR